MKYSLIKIGFLAAAGRRLHLPFLIIGVRVTCRSDLWHEASVRLFVVVLEYCEQTKK